MSTNKKSKEFKLSSLAIDNKMTVYVIMALFFVLGISAYYAMPREDFPEIKETKIYISTIYPGNTAEDIERLIIDPLEEDIKNVSNVVEILSTSQEDYGIITVEFDEKITVEEAKQKVKDKVDGKKSNEDWPTFNGVKVEPNVFDLNLSEEIPILNINLSGDFPIEKLKEFGEYLKDEIEGLAEIKEVNIRGAQEKEVEVAVDVFKMMASKVSFDDVITAIRNGNVTMSAGNIISSGQRRTISIKGEIEKPTDLENFVVKTQNGIVYLKDVAKVSFKNVDKTTYAREFGKSVVMLDVKKRAGKNMIEASEKIKTIIAEAKENVLPKDLNLTLSNDSSSKTLNQVDDLVNNVIFGIILVVGVLMFFLGFRNALFVGFAIPMSMFLSFMVLDALGYTMNTMILFGLIMGLGMLVDNGIVVVENVFRLMEDEGMDRMQAAKEGIGEIAMPIIISTLTTVAAFVPLGLWPGVMGQFMVYFPITLSVVLGSSLFVAIFFNSVLVSQFMDINEKILTKKQLIRLTLILGSFGLLILFFGGAVRGLGSLMIFTVAMFWLYKYVIKDRTLKFQNNTLNKLEDSYEKALKFFLSGKKPYMVVVGMFFMFFIVLISYFGWSVGSGRTKVEFFPDNKPNQIIVYIEYPQGTDIEKTNNITKDIEKRVYAVLDSKEFVNEETKSNYLVESAVSQVGEGAGNPQTDGGSSAEMPHKAKITVSMQEYKFREGRDSEEMRLKVQEALKDIYPGISISVEKDQAGPPAGYPINIEIKGKDYTELIVTAERMKEFINGRNVPGIDELKVDVNKGKPAMRVQVDREKAGGMGISASQVGNQLRRSVFGEKAGVYKEKGEDYDINVRFNYEDRYNQSTLFNQNITFRDMASGQLKEIPVSTVASQKNTSSFSAIKHRDLNRVVVLYSALSPGFTDAGSVVNQIQAEMADFDAPKSVKFDFTGQIEEQNKQMSFLMGALFTGLGLIMLILVFQFNSISKPAIIMVAVFLSFIGVFLGLMITGWPFVIMMTMMGIISLAGIVVNNGVVLLDYTELLLSRKKEELNLPESNILDKEYIFEAIVNGGKARLRPVLLTAITTVLGLIPLAIGFNIDFFSLFSELDPKIYIGGDNVIFWGPLAWTVIFGLVFATFLTLIVVPVLYYLVNLFKLWRIGKKNKTITS
ncbi:MAG TPA: efflux RND transporter permease subunit [Flavobacterium sp.]|uniref:efflux RND transporter permease subunit n=1 Tax=Flavobacterium sp. TaxID=239 RepID=UPI002F404C7F